MLTVPFLLGTILRARAGEPLVPLVPLFGFWIVGYVAFHLASGLLKAAPGRRQEWVRPLTGAVCAATVLGVTTLALSGPGVLAWVPAFAPLLVSALALARARRERTLAGGALTVAAASLMTVVARHPDPLALPTHPDAAALGAALGTFAYFFGTVWYVRTLIRERGNSTYLIASLAWHATATVVAAVLALGGVAPWWWTILFAALTARACLVPRLRPPPAPWQVGVGEIASCVVLVGAFALG